MLKKNLLTTRNAAFVLLFIALAVVADQINVAKVWGAPGQTFTLFQILGPLPGFFLGPVMGVAAVLISQIINFVALGKSPEIINILRLLPMLGGAYYFSTHGKGKHALAIPVLAIILFNLHPNGAAAWFYSLFWLIPIICALFFQKSLFCRALGATFTAHSIGGSFWNYFTNSPPEMWIALIPVTATERFLFAIGITVSFVAVNYVLNRYFANTKAGFPHVDRQISLF